jgi:hypothetical protein
MGIFQMIVAVVALGCITGLLFIAMDTVKQVLLARPRLGGSDPALRDALNELREEVRQLRQTTQDGVLSFDATLQRLEARLQHVEQRALGAGQAAPVRGIVVPAPNTVPVPTTVPVAGVPQTTEEQAQARAR